jgi:hypothetical protein
MKFPKLPPELNRARRLMPRDIEKAKRELPQVIERLGNKKRAYKYLGEMYGVSADTIVRNCVWTEERRRRHDAYKYARHKQYNQERNNSPKGKEFRKKYAREKRVRQRQEVNDYLRPFSRSYRKRVNNSRRRNDNLNTALNFAKQNSIKQFNAHYKNPHFIKKLLEAEPLLVLMRDTDGTSIRGIN